MYLSLLVASLGIIFSSLVYLFRKIDSELLYRFFNIFRLYDLSKNKFYIDEIYSNILYKPFMFWSKVSSKIDWDFYDQKIVDSLGKLTLFASNKSTKVDYDWLDQIIVDGFSQDSQLYEYEVKKYSRRYSSVLYPWRTCSSYFNNITCTTNIRYINMESWILSTLIFLPVIGVLVMCIVSMLNLDEDKTIYKYIALATTGIQLILSVWLYINFDPSIQFLTRLIQFR